MPSGFFYNSLDLPVHFQYKGCLILSVIEIHEFNASGVDPDQTPRSAASDLGLRCFLMCLLWDARLKWVKYYYLNKK